MGVEGKRESLKVGKQHDLEFGGELIAGLGHQVDLRVGTRTAHQDHQKHRGGQDGGACSYARSEEHTSELQSRLHLVCRLLLEKKNSNNPPRLAQPMLESLLV